MLFSQLLFNYYIFLTICIIFSAPHVGECIAQLIERILETGQNDIHLIGFSLGAQVSNYVANKLKPDFIIPRISGLGKRLTELKMYMIKP